MGRDRIEISLYSLLAARNSCSERDGVCWSWAVHSLGFRSSSKSVVNSGILMLAVEYTDRTMSRVIVEME